MPTVTFTLTESGGKLVSSPDSHTVVQHDTEVLFVLSGQAANDFRLTGYTSTDTLAQLGPAVINKEGTQMSILDANTKADQINITVMSQRRSSHAAGGTDPIVINLPPD